MNGYAYALLRAEKRTLLIEEKTKRIAELEAIIKDLRQRLIGGVEGVKAGRDLTKWARANDRYLRWDYEA